MANKPFDTVKRMAEETKTHREEEDGAGMKANTSEEVSRKRSKRAKTKATKLAQSRSIRNLKSLVSRAAGA
jgi:hypothetical protein